MSGTPEQFRNWSILAYRALADADNVLTTIDPENDTEAAMLFELRRRINDLCYQALSLHDVTTGAALANMEEQQA